MIWKVFGPDLNGRFGGLQGTGGLEAVILDADGTTTGVINDQFGNGVATVTGTGAGASVTWNATRVGAYGPLPGVQAQTLTDVTQLAASTAWRSRRIDPTGFYWLGARYYEPTSGRFLSADPAGHAASPSLYDYAGGDPVNYFDPTGRCKNSSDDIEYRLHAIFSDLRNELNQNAIDSLNDRLSRIDALISNTFCQLDKINGLYDDANIYNDLSMAQTVLTTVFGAGAMAKELAGVTVRTSVTALPGAMGSVPLQGVIPLEYGGGIVAAGSGQIAAMNAELATVRYANYTVTAGGILLKETAKDRTVKFAQESIDFLHAGLDPFGWLAKDDISIADRQARTAQTTMAKLTAEKKDLLQQLSQLGK